MLLTDGKVSLAEFEVLACQHFSHSQHVLQEVMITHLSLTLCLTLLTVCLLQSQLTAMPDRILLGCKDVTTVLIDLLLLLICSFFHLPKVHCSAVSCTDKQKPNTTKQYLLLCQDLFEFSGSQACCLQLQYV